MIKTIYKIPISTPNQFLDPTIHHIPLGIKALKRRMKLSREMHEKYNLEWRGHLPIRTKESVDSHPAGRFHPSLQGI